MQWSDYWQLIRLAAQRNRGKAHRYQFHKLQAELLVQFLQKKGIDLAGKRVLDLGCSLGGYSEVFAANGAEVVAVDVRNVFRAIDPHITFVQSSGTELALADAVVDFVFCASLIEHVASPDKLLREINRVLRPDGVCYLSFPPFYSPVGGHEFKPYHLLGERLAIKLSRRRLKKRLRGREVQSFATEFGAWGLYPLTIRQVRQMICETELEITNMSTRYSPINFARLPVLGEFLTWHVQFILCK